VSRRPALDALEQVEIGSSRALRDWLAAHHHQAASVWIVTFRKPDPRHVPWGEIVDAALCFGWIDSLPRRLDDARTMVLLSPRRPGSAWSAVNKAKVAALTEAGLMAPAGLAAVAAASDSGTWNRLDAAHALVVPPDLEAALAAHPGAADHFAAFSASSRRGILEWIELARRPQTRASCVETTARLAAENRKANHPG